MIDSNVHYLPSLDELLRERFTAATVTPRPSDWADVRQRARRLGYRGRRTGRWSYVALAASLAVTAAVVAPALGLTDRIIPFFSTASASKNVVLAFSKMNHVGDGRGPGAIASDARSVYVFRLASGDHTLSLTRTSGGSFCWVITEFSSGCQTILSAHGPYKTGELDPVRIGLTFTDIPAPTMKQEPVLIGGNIRSSAADRLQVEFEDGHDETIPYVWVSEPIDAGFFLYEVPDDRWQAGKRPIALALSSADGKLLSRVTFSVTATIDDYVAQHGGRG